MSAITPVGEGLAQVVPCALPGADTRVPRHGGAHFGALCRADAGCLSPNANVLGGVLRKMPMMCFPGGASVGRHGGDGQFQQRALRGAAVLAVVPGVLDVIDAGADVYGWRGVRAGRAGMCHEFGQGIRRPGLEAIRGLQFFHRFRARAVARAAAQPAPWATGAFGAHGGAGGADKAAMGFRYGSHCRHGRSPPQPASPATPPIEWWSRM